MNAKPPSGAIRLRRHSDSYWRVTFDLAPLNIFGPENIPQLESIIALLESEERLKVVVFDSAIEGFFLTHYDFLAPPQEPSPPSLRSGLQPLPDLLVRLSRAPVVSIASIRGRPTTRRRLDKLMELGFHQPGDVENRLGHYLEQIQGDHSRV